MIRIALFATLIALPALAQDNQKSEVGTAFLERCLADVSAHRIATLKRQVPEYAATLSDEELNAGAMTKAKTACPCFLQVIAVNPEITDGTPEEKVESVMDYLNSLDTDEVGAIPPMVTRLTRLCGERSSILPPSWIGQ